MRVIFARVRGQVQPANQEHHGSMQCLDRSIQIQQSMYAQRTALLSTVTTETFVAHIHFLQGRMERGL